MTNAWCCKNNFWSERRREWKVDVLSNYDEFLEGFLWNVKHVMCIPQKTSGRKWWKMPDNKNNMEPKLFPALHYKEDEAIQE